MKPTFMANLFRVVSGRVTVANLPAAEVLMLDVSQLEAFQRDGYLVIPDALDAFDLDPVRTEYEAVLDQAAHDLYELGELSSTYSGLPFDQRYIAMITECPGVFYYLGISLPLDYETLDPHWIRVHSGPVCCDWS